MCWGVLGVCVGSVLGVCWKWRFVKPFTHSHGKHGGHGSVYGNLQATLAFGDDNWRNYSMVKDMVDELKGLVEKVPEWEEEFRTACTAMKAKLAKVEHGIALRELLAELDEARSAKQKSLAGIRSKAKGIKAAISKKDKESAAGLSCVQLDGAEDVTSEKGIYYNEGRSDSVGLRGSLTFYCWQSSQLFSCSQFTILRRGPQILDLTRFDLIPLVPCVVCR